MEKKKVLAWTAGIIVGALMWYVLVAICPKEMVGAGPGGRWGAIPFLTMVIIALASIVGVAVEYRYEGIWINKAWRQYQIIMKAQTQSEALPAFNEMVRLLERGDLGIGSLWRVDRKGNHEYDITEHIANLPA